MIYEVISDLEAERGLPAGKIALIALIETPNGLANAAGIARSDPRLTAMLLGSEDFATACRMEPNPETLMLAKQSRAMLGSRSPSIPLCGNHATGAVR